MRSCASSTRSFGSTRIWRRRRSRAALRRRTSSPGTCSGRCRDHTPRRAQAYTCSGGESTLALWRRFRELSVEKYAELYARLNVRFDVYAGEPQVSEQEVRQAIDVLRAEELSSTKAAKEDDASQWKGKKVDDPLKEPAVKEPSSDKGLALAVDL
jgi:arginyl-tRNA synthetase